MFDRQAATQLAAVLLGLSALLILLERVSRGRARFTQGRRPTAPTPTRLTGLRAAAAAGFCGTVWTLGFGLPVGQLLLWAVAILRRDGLAPGFLRALGNSLGLAAAAAGLTLAVALVLAYAVRIRPPAGSRRSCASHRSATRCPARSSRWVFCCRCRGSTTPSPGR